MGSPSRPGSSSKSPTSRLAPVYRQKVLKIQVFVSSPSMLTSKKPSVAVWQQTKVVSKVRGRPGTLQAHRLLFRDTVNKNGTTAKPTPSVSLLRCRALDSSFRDYRTGCPLFRQDSSCRAQHLLNHLHLVPLRIDSCLCGEKHSSASPSSRRN